MGKYVWYCKILWCEEYYRKLETELDLIRIGIIKLHVNMSRYKRGEAEKKTKTTMT